MREHVLGRYLGIVADRTQAGCPADADLLWYGSELMKDLSVTFESLGHQSEESFRNAVTDIVRTGAKNEVLRHVKILQYSGKATHKAEWSRLSDALDLVGHEFESHKPGVTLSQEKLIKIEEALVLLDDKRDDAARSREWHALERSLRNFLNPPPVETVLNVTREKLAAMGQPAPAESRRPRDDRGATPGKAAL